MNLRYIALGLDYDTYINTDNKLRYEFQCHTRFISNYFSKHIRKYKFETDGTFNMISISLLPDGKSEPSKIMAMDVLKTYLSFDESRYEKIKGTSDCEYYLELLDEGFRKASEFKKIPLSELFNLIEEFKQGGCRNEWLHKKKRFKDRDIEVILTCEFTTNHFQLITQINQISTKNELAKGIAIKTRPDEIHFDKMFKDILVQDSFILITDASDSPRILISLKDAINGVFVKTFPPYNYNEDYSREENLEAEKAHKKLIEILSYDGGGFKILKKGSKTVANRLELER